jgi:hypothetical protein
METHAADRRTDSVGIPLEELRRELDALERGSFAALNDDELRERVKQIHEGLTARGESRKG